jgi:hypothetical protein
MLQLEFPTINVLTKIDNLVNFPDLPFNLDFYTEVQDLDYLLPYLDRERLGPIEPGTTSNSNVNDDPPVSKFASLNKAITELVQDYALVGFEPLAVEDRASMSTLLRAIDKASGYAFGASGAANDRVWEVAMQDAATSIDVRDVQERWIERRREFDALETEAWKQEGDEWKALNETKKEEPKEGQGGSGDGDVEEEEEEEEEKQIEVDDPDFDDAKVVGKRGMMGRDAGIKIVRKQNS